MRIGQSRILKTLTAHEREVALSAAGDRLAKLNPSALREMLRRARRAAERHRDLAHGGRRQRQRRVGARGAAQPDERQEEKAAFFAEVQRRLELRTALLEARAKRVRVAPQPAPAARSAPAKPARAPAAAKEAPSPTSTAKPPRARARDRATNPAIPARNHQLDQLRLAATANLKRRQAHVGARTRRKQAKRDARR